MQGTAGDKEVAQLANLCEVSPKVIEELDMKDYVKLQKMYSGFLGLTQETQD